MYEFKEVDWLSLDREKTRVQIGVLADEYVLSHIRNAFVSWEIINERWDWTVEFNVVVAIGEEEIPINVSTGYFHLYRNRGPELTPTEEVVILLEAARETILRRMVDKVFRAKPYTLKGKEPDWNRSR